MDKNTPGCFSNGLEDRPKEDFQSFNEVPAEKSDAESDENPINLEVNSDSYDELPVSDEDDDVQLSSPSNSLNSDVDQRWYAFRGRWGIVDNNHNDINNRRLDNQLPEINQPQQPQEEEETDFLEMDFEPDTNSEIENEATLPTLPNGPQHASSNTNSFNFLNHPPLPLPLPQPEFRIISLPAPVALVNEPEILIRPVNRETGAKPKQPSTLIRPQKVSKHVSEGDNVFKMCSNINNNNNNHIDSLSRPTSIFSCAKNSDEVYNLGASSSRTTHPSDRHESQQSYNHDVNSFMKIHKSPSKAASHHHNHKHQRLHEEQNDQFLFEIEPIKPRNSVTIYTTNCDEKILIDALVSFNQFLMTNLLNF